MNKYAVLAFQDDETEKKIEKVLIRYDSTEGKKEDPYFKGVKVVFPEILEIVEISDDKFRWKSDDIYDWYGNWEEIYVYDSEEISVPLFEAEDDNAAKLIYEVGGYIIE